MEDENEDKELSPVDTMKALMEQRIEALDQTLVGQLTSSDTWRKEPEYCEDYPEKLLEWLSKGNSFESFAGFVGVSPKILESWVERYPTFKQAYEVGDSISLGHWEKLAKLQAAGVVKGSSQMIQYIMNNRFSDRYKQKQDSGISADVVYQFNTGVDRGVEAEDNDKDEAKDLL